MKALITLVMSFLLGSSAFANDFAVALGIRSNSADSSAIGRTVNTKTGIGAGVVGFFDISESFQIRSGFLYNQKNVASEITGGETELNLAYIDIPLTAMYRFAEYGGVFAGPVVGLLASKECKSPAGTSCFTTSNPQSSVVGLQLGVSFKFAPQMGGELYYETISSEYWKGALENSRSVGANLLFTFE